MKLLKAIASVFTIGVLLTSAGCGEKKEDPKPPAQGQEGQLPPADGKNPPPKPDGQNPPPNETGQKPGDSQVQTRKQLTLKVYYPDEGATHLVAVDRAVDVEDGKDKYTAAVETIIQEPTESNLVAIFPKATQVRSVKVEGDLATVDFDGSIQRTFSGGSTGEELLVGSLVDTLTDFPEINRVQILVDGNAVESLAGHMDISKPFERMNNLLQ